MAGSIHLFSSGTCNNLLKTFNYNPVQTQLQLDSSDHSSQGYVYGIGDTSADFIFHNKKSSALFPQTEKTVMFGCEGLDRNTIDEPPSTQGSGTFILDWVCDGCKGSDWIDLNKNVTKSCTKMTNKLNDENSDYAEVGNEPHNDVILKKMQNETEQETKPKLMHEELKAAHDALHLTQSRFHDYQVKTNLIVTSLKSQLYKKEHEMRWQREHHERQAKTIVSHLLFLEGQLRKDQKRILGLLEEKEKLIKQQKVEIEGLTSANLKLLTALKEFHIPIGSNGIHENKLVPEDFSSPKQKSVSEFDRNRAHKKRFTEMRERLRRHRSSFELHNPEPLETLEEGAFRYGSQDNLSDSKEKDIVKERRMSLPSQKERPRSLTDFPGKITEYPLLELHKECDLKIEDLELEEEEIDKNEDEIFVNGDCEQSCMIKSNTVPEELSQSMVNGQNKNNSKKQRPLSESGIGLISLEKNSKSPNKTGHNGQSPGETNPFKSIKTMLRRKGSKLKNKKRSVSLPQGANQEYYEALKKHFDKYDLS